MALPTAPFNTAKSLFAGLSVLVLRLVSTITSVTAATTVVTKTAHGLSTNDTLRYKSGTGWTGLTADKIYYVIKLDADTFNLAATPGGAAIAVGTSSAGIFQPVQVFEASKVDNKLEQETESIMRPASNGVKRKVRTVTTSEQESYEFIMDEPKRLLDIFGGKLCGRVDGYCQIFMPDPNDATNFCSLVSEMDFACSFTRAGDMTAGDAKFTTPNIKIESNKAGAVSWTADLAV